MAEAIGKSIIKQIKMAVKKPRFTPYQKKAIKQRGGHLRILACAGSGKTMVICERIAGMIKEGISPKKIVAFTFTVKAAEEMKARIREILERECPNKSDFGDMYVGTLDGFCFEMLQEIDPRYKNYDILEGAKQVAYLSKPMNSRRMKLRELSKYGKTTNLKEYTIIDRFISSSAIMMMEMVDPEKLSNKDFQYSYKKYLELMEEDKYLDFALVIKKLIHLLENRENRKLFSEKIKHLTVDEYQDINTIQEKLIDIISQTAESVCVVGDDDQCIFQWRGSQFENIMSFEDRYKEKGFKVITIPLNKNFRSTRHIIHTAREFIKNNKNREKLKEMDYNKELKRNHEKGDFVYHFADDEEKEGEFILERINKLIGTDFLNKKNEPYALSLGDFAVLVRSNEKAAKILEYLKNRGTECIAYSGAAIFGTDEVKLALDCMSYIFKCKSYGYGPTPTKKVLIEEYKEVFKRSEFLKADADIFVNDLEDLSRSVDRIIAKSPNDYLGELGLQYFYHKILSALGAQRFDFSESYHYHLAVLSSAISDYESVWKRLRAKEVDGFFNFAKAFGESNYTETQFENASLVNAVKIMTIHKSKGLEFPVVFIPEMIKKRKKKRNPVFVDDRLYSTKTYDSDEEDERRVLYTAITRSEHYLFISGSKTKEGKVNPYEEHPFISELDKKFIADDGPVEKKKSGYEPRKLHEAIFPTSFSELTTYDRCPYDFWIRNICGYNAGVPPAFGYGTNIHNILNIIHNVYIKTEKIPNNNEIERLVDNVFHLRYATEAISKNMRKSALKIIKNYVKIQKGEFKKILETEKRFEFVIDDALISGQIDLLKKLDESGNVQEVEIIDFKTEGEKAKKPYAMDYEKQLRLYALACMKSLGLNPKKAVIHHLDKNLFNKRTKVDISEEKLEDTKKGINETVTKILDKKFTSNQGSLCSDCDYKYICSKKKKCFN